MPEIAAKACSREADEVIEEVAKRRAALNA